MVPVTSVHGARRARVRRELASQLKRAGAVSPDRAIPLEPGNRMEEQVLSRMIKRELVRPGMKGGYWLDAERYAECRQRETIFAIGLLLVMAGLMACMILYAKPQHRNRHAMETEVVFPLP